MIFIKGEAVEFRGTLVGSFYRPQEKSYSIESWGDPGLRERSIYLLSLFGIYSTMWGHFWKQEKENFGGSFRISILSSLEGLRRIFSRLQLLGLPQVSLRDEAVP